MSKVVTVEELVANIDEFVDDVKRGETLTLLQNGATVAEMRPVASMEGDLELSHVPPPGVRPGDFRPKGLGRPLDFDPLEYWRADRDRERNG